MTVITKKRIDEETKKKENEGGWFGFFKQKKVEEVKNEDDVLSSEEIERVYKTLYDKFLKNDSLDDEKSIEFKNIKTMKIELIVQKGGLNLINKDTKMNLFFKDCSFRMNKFADEKLCIEARTNDFGLKMQADQHYEVIEKMDESEVFWEMKYLSFSPGNEIDSSLDLKINPIKVVYEGSFIKSIVSFFKNDSDLQLKEQAAEKWTDFKEGAHQQIQESMKAGKKDVKISISSPILLIPLQVNNPNSKLWAINLGDFLLESETPKDSYEYYKFEVSTVMIKFYQEYTIWERCARFEIQRRKVTKLNIIASAIEIPKTTIEMMLGFAKFYQEYTIWERCARFEIQRRKVTKLNIIASAIEIPKTTIESNNFTLLEEFRIDWQLAINKSNKTKKGRSDVEVMVNSSPININMNDEIYNHLVNIHRWFTYENPEDIAKGMIDEKSKIINNSTLISTIK